VREINDLQSIKQQILSNPDDIQTLLESMGCTHVKLRNNRYEARLPDKFDSDNTRSVQVKLNENLSCVIRSRGVEGIDIYGLVSYIHGDKYSEREQFKDLPNAKKYILQTLNYFEYNSFRRAYEADEKEDHLAWIKTLRKARRKSESITEIPPNPILSTDVLKQFDFFPPKIWIDEGISYQTMKEFQIGIDLYSDRIIFPIHNFCGDFIGVKGRYMGNNKEIEEKYKYLYLIPCDKSKELFNIHRALPYILEKKEVQIVEGAKTVMIAWSNGIKNMVSIEGDHITHLQIHLLKTLGIDIKFVFAWDKNKDKEFIEKQLESFKGRLIYILYDTLNLFKDKESPLDRGIEVYKQLYEKCQYKFK
jgi:DNA primase